MIANHHNLQLSDTLLSVLSTRSGEIVSSIFGENQPQLYETKSKL